MQSSVILILFLTFSSSFGVSFYAKKDEVSLSRVKRDGGVITAALIAAGAGLIKGGGGEILHMLNIFKMQ